MSRLRRRLSVPACPSARARFPRLLEQVLLRRGKRQLPSTHRAVEGMFKFVHDRRGQKGLRLKVARIGRVPPISRGT